MLHQYVVLDCVKFPFVVVMLVLLLMSFVVWKLTHGPEELLLHVAFMVSMVLLSHTMACSVGTGQILVVVLAGVSVWSFIHGLVFGSAVVVKW